MSTWEGSLGPSRPLKHLRKTKSRRSFASARSAHSRTYLKCKTSWSPYHPCSRTQMTRSDKRLPFHWAASQLVTQASSLSRSSKWFSSHSLSKSTCSWAHWERSSTVSQSAWHSLSRSWCLFTSLKLAVTMSQSGTSSPSQSVSCTSRILRLSRRCCWMHCSPVMLWWLPHAQKHSSTLPTRQSRLHHTSASSSIS